MYTIRMHIYYLFSFKRVSLVKTQNDYVFIHWNTLGCVWVQRWRFTRMAIPIMKIRESGDRLIFIVVIHISGKMIVILKRILEVIVRRMAPAWCWEGWFKITEWMRCIILNTMGSIQFWFNFQLIYLLWFIFRYNVIGLNNGRLVVQGIPLVVPDWLWSKGDATKNRGVGLGLVQSGWRSGWLTCI